MIKNIQKYNKLITIYLISLFFLRNIVVKAEELESISTPTENINNSISNLNTISYFLIFILGILLIILIIKVLTLKNNLNQVVNNQLGELTDTEIKNIDATLDIKMLKETTFELYKKLETAKTKQNIKNLKTIVTDELYSEQEQNIKSLKEQHQKEVSTNINLENFKVLSIEMLNNIPTILTYLHVSQYDYVIDKQKTVIRGTSDALYQIEYKITLEQTPDKQFKIKKKECIGKWIKN